MYTHSLCISNMLTEKAAKKEQCVSSTQTDHCSLTNIGNLTLILIALKYKILKRLLLSLFSSTNDLYKNSRHLKTLMQ